jgi:hypothetical protein
MSITTSFPQTSIAHTLVTNEERESNSLHSNPSEHDTTLYHRIEISPPIYPSNRSHTPVEELPFIQALASSPNFARAHCIDGRPFHWQGLVLEMDYVEELPLKKGQLIDINYRDRNMPTILLGQIVGRWCIQDRSRWILFCKMGFVNLHFLLVLPRDGSAFRHHSHWEKLIRKVLPFTVAKEYTYKD